MAIAFGYQVKSVERDRFHMRVISALRDCAVFASLKTRSPSRFNDDQELSLISSSPRSRVAHVDVFKVGRIAAGVGIAAAHFCSCNEAGCPCWTCIPIETRGGYLLGVQRWPEREPPCAIR